MPPPQLKLCVATQTPLVRFLHDGANDLHEPSLREFEEGKDYETTPGGVTRMVRTLARRLHASGRVGETRWLALAPSGPRRVRVDEGLALQHVRLDDADLRAYVRAKAAAWNAIHGLPVEDDVTSSDVIQGLGTIARAMGRAARGLRERNLADAYFVHDFQLVDLARHLPRGSPKLFQWHVPVPSKIPPLLDEVFDRLNEFDGVVASSSLYAERLRAADVRVPVHVIPPFVDGTRQVAASPLQAKRFRRKWRLPPGSPVFLVVARMDPMKAQDVAIRALAAATSAPKAVLVLVGGGGFSGGRRGGLRMEHAERWRRQLGALARELGVEERVVFTGTLAEDELDAAYSRATAVLLPSREEGFGLTVAEAWLRGKPTLVSRGAGISSLARDGVDGWTFDPGDHEALARGIERLAADPALAEAMGNAARASAEPCRARHGVEAAWSALELTMDRAARRGRSSIRVLLTDLDRTLTGPDFEPDARALARIAELRRLGVRVVLVTGRSLDHIVSHALHLVADVVVAENGAVVARGSDPTLEVADERFAARARRALGPLAASFEWGLAIGSAPIALARRAAALLKALDVSHSTAFNANEGMLLPPGVSKATGAKRALALLGIDAREAAAIGDGENDAGMLSMVGVSGAPGNAVPAALARATHRLRESYADGFLAFTERIFRVELEEGRRSRPAL